jgi:1,2-beta-oligoglucan phosphorylase
MPHSRTDRLTTPRQDDLGLARIVNEAGLSISLLPNGAIFAMEHAEGGRRIMINQTFASPIAGGMGRLYLRAGGVKPVNLPVIGPEALCSLGAADDRFVWEGERHGVSHKVTLWLHPRSNVWLWRVEVVNRRADEFDPPPKWWTPLISSKWSRKVFYGYVT